MSPEAWRVFLDLAIELTIPALVIIAAIEIRERRRAR